MTADGTVAPTKRRSVRTNRKTVTPDAETTSQSGGDSDATVSAVASSKRRVRPQSSTAILPASTLSPIVAYFLACFVLGEAAAIAGQLLDVRPLQWAGPILAMFLYLWLGASKNWTRETSMREEFADTTYFLGFAFTLASLLVLFGLPAILGDKVDAQDIIDRFGVALGASVIGLIARAVIEGSGRVSDTGKDPEVAIQEAKQQLTRDLQASTEGFLKLTADLSTRLTEMLVLTEGQLNKVRELNTGFIEDLANSRDEVRGVGAAVSSGSAAVASTIGQFSSQIDSFRRDFHETMVTTLADMQNAIRDFADATQAVKAIATTTSDLPRLMSDVRGRVESGSAAVTSELGSAAEHVRRMNEALSSVSEHLGAVQQSSADGAALLRAQVEQQMGELRTSLLQAVAGISSHAEASAKQGAEKLSADLDRAREAFAQSVVKFGEELKTLQQIMVKR